MKKWIIIIAVVLLALIVIGVLHEAGYLNFKWTTLTTIFAALSGPYTYIKNKLFNTNNVDSVKDLIEKSKQGLLHDEEHRDLFDNQIEAKQQEITRLENKISQYDKRINELEVEASNAKAEIREMSSEELAKAFETYYGNEKDE